VIVVNKWDQVDSGKWTEESYNEEVKAQLRHVEWASVVCTTASEGEGEGGAVARG
jgi:GTP-binding protein